MEKVKHSDPRTLDFSCHLLLFLSSTLSSCFNFFQAISLSISYFPSPFSPKVVAIQFLESLS